jgi:general secretion pathway protein K
MTNRRGFAMLAAMWLVVAIAAVVLQFSLDARERRQLGLSAAERGRGRAAALGAVTQLQARVEATLRQLPQRATGPMASLRSSDPLLDADSVYGGVTLVDSVPVAIRIRDLGSVLNLNAAGEPQLRAFFGFLLKDVMLADQLAQRIVDWRDPDTLARVNGAERDQYIREGLLVLPTNTSFREVDELQHVMGMTPEIFEMIRGYFTTRGAQDAVNLNSAPEAVLRSLPGVSDQIVSTILARRSGGQRISDMGSIFSATRQGGGAQNAALQRMQQLATLTVDQIEVTLTSQPEPHSVPAVVTAVMSRGGQSMTVMSKQW